MYLAPLGKSPVAERATAIIERAVNFIFPWGTYCICCGNYIDRERSYCICDHCIRQITWGNVEIPTKKFKELDSIRACMKYGLYERRIIFELKYNGKTFMARIIAQIIYDRIINDKVAEGELLQADYIVPVPVHKSKLRSRGFNQAERIGKHLGKHMNIPILPDALARTKKTSAQRSVAGRERYANLNGAFIPGKSSEKIKGKNIILLDDIYTTGATATHCAQILKDAGAKRVDFLALASSNDRATGYFE